MLKTKAFKPRHICEHVCDTFMGCSVRSRDVKSVPPLVLSKSKGGMEERRNSSALAAPAGLAQMLLAQQTESSCPPPHRAVWGAEQPPVRVSCPQCPQTLPAGAWLSPEGSEDGLQVLPRADGSKLSETRDLWASPLGPAAGWEAQGRAGRGGVGSRPPGGVNQRGG